MNTRHLLFDNDYRNNNNRDGGDVAFKGRVDRNGLPPLNTRHLLFDNDYRNNNNRDGGDPSFTTGRVDRNGLPPVNTRHHHFDDDYRNKIMFCVIINPAFEPL